jgi:putative transposase
MSWRARDPHPARSASSSPIIPAQAPSIVASAPIYRKPRTSIPPPLSAVYRYLLTGLKIERPNHVWAADLTYLPMAHGFQYLVAIIDVGSRKTLSWRVSNTMTADFCVEALQEALEKYGKPQIFNTDQAIGTW